MGDATFGFVVPCDKTDRLMTVAQYMGITPYDLIINSIDRLYEAYEEQVKIGGG